MAKVSLIVPIYNTEKYLKKCITSLVEQTLDDIEILLINDGSTDNSEKTIKSFKDKRIKYITKANEGIGKTRNLGIDIAQGEYLAFVDSDDYLTKDFCEKMYNKAKKDKCDLVICDFYKDDKTLKEVRFITFEDTNIKKMPELINYINLGPCNKLYKKELFINKNNRFIENLKYEDAPLVIKILLSAKKIGKVDECLTNYVIHEKSQTTVRDERIYDILKIVDIIVNDLKEANHPTDSITNLITMILLDYNIQQRYILSKIERNKFIDEVFEYLNKLDKNWKKSDYLKTFPFLKRIIKTNNILTKLYCYIYILMHN